MAPREETSRDLADQNGLQNAKRSHRVDQRCSEAAGKVLEKEEAAVSRVDTADLGRRTCWGHSIAEDAAVSRAHSGHEGCGGHCAFESLSRYLKDRRALNGGDLDVAHRVRIGPGPGPVHEMESRSAHVR